MCVHARTDTKSSLVDPSPFMCHYSFPILLLPSSLPSSSPPFPPFLSPPLLPGLVGVSPSPSNCSSVDNTTNTCTVPATVGSPLTLCADFTQHPEGAKQYTEPFKTVWKQDSASGENVVWECSRDRCNMSTAEEWGRCLQVDRVEENSVFNYTIVEVLPPREYPSAFTGIVHRSVLFNMQG